MLDLVEYMQETIDRLLDILDSRDTYIEELEDALNTLIDILEGK
jgi:hypothetical protein